MATLRDQGKSRDTINSYVARLKTFIAHLVRLNLLRPDVLDSVHIPERVARGRKNWLRQNEVEKVIQAVAPAKLSPRSKAATIEKAKHQADNLKFILHCGFHAGLRRNEISNAKVNWFDLEHCLIHIQNDPKSGFILKDRENRTVPLTTSFGEFLKTFLAGKQKDSYVLKPKQQNGVWRYRYDFNRMVRTHFAKCKVTGPLHDMRRSFASDLVSAGETIYVVAGWLGDGVQVVERSYGHLHHQQGTSTELLRYWTAMV